MVIFTIIILLKIIDVLFRRDKCIRKCYDYYSDRDAVLGDRMRKCSDSEIKTESNVVYNWSAMTFYMVTWNVNNKHPPVEGIESLLTPANNNVKAPDFYCIALEEIDLTTKGLLNGQTNKSKPWKNAIEQTLAKIHRNDGEKYVHICDQQMVGLYVLVYTRAVNVPRIKNIKASHIGTGIMKRMGNKGGVGISFTVYDAKVMIVGAHFNAHTEGLQRRNKDYKTIIKKLGEYSTIFVDHDIIIWLGDLNYRLDPCLSYDHVLSKINDKQYDYLYQYDQLKMERAANKVFCDFEEGKIDFPPTYKFDVKNNPDQYLPKDKLLRIPAWCDRILWNVCDRTKQSNEKINKMNDIIPGKLKPYQINYSEYRWHPSYRISDHKPVSCLLTCAIKRSEINVDIISF